MISSRSFCLAHLSVHFVVISVGAGYDSIIPDAPGAESHPSTSVIAEKVSKSVEQYLDAMEKVNDALVHCVKPQNHSTTFHQVGC